jgi:hypothetical protein
MNAAVKLRPADTPPATDGPRVYGAIAAVMAEIAKEGIAKDRSNQAQGYKFRGIDDVYNALAPVLSKHALLMLPNVLRRDVIERQSNKGATLFYVTVEAEFALISAEDGSSHTIKTYGEAMDSGDKATNKAMSAAYKYAAMQAFCIPTEGDNDADAVTHEVAPRQAAKPAAEPAKTPTLAERADKLERALGAAKDAEAVTKTLALASKLCAELDAKDPERLAELIAYSERRLADLGRIEPTKTPFDDEIPY